jgi:SnoaL-like protein
MGIARSVALYRAIFPDLQIRVLDQTTDGDRVTSRWELHGTRAHTCATRATFREATDTSTPTVGGRARYSTKQ